ncbi:hypothetical protein KP591P3_00041 [Klebsiella phage KP591P3]|uniref:hypothetical protein n=1 Tax=Klebsiella phage KP591P1 TaxID=2968665 RepID=UPI00233EA791|nr:hypothetical protein PRB84_gp77 [Klebsiella phage KP591P1]YP_010685454.1 hypothetical protein PRB85_gp77 [Klebsiella phage KP591P3]WAX16356.1 hypothetical protein KP591P1_00078 [Klebsiella phage KP591P1]WAX16397.1 hypothetical protein KP591P3_00041 [Klebsiella phage KP591P3]
MSDSKGDESRYSCEQYLDAIVTIELAARLAILEHRPVNRAIRSCWSAIRPRIDNKLNRQIFDGMVNQIMPHGALCMLRRQLDAAISEEDDDH